MHKKLMRRIIFLLVAILLISCGSLVSAETVDRGDYGGNVTYVLDSEGTLTISGTGDMEKRHGNHSDKVKRVIIEDGVTSIPQYGFVLCKNLQEVILPDSIVSIGEEAFRDCSNLTSVILGDGLTSIRNGAFSGCTGLTSVAIPDSVISIGDSAFYSCTGLTSVAIPDSVIFIGDSAFYNCTGLTAITISNSVTSIDGAFSGCSSLTSITIPNSVTSIDGAFSGCSSLTSITIPNSVTSIDSAFSGCSSLTSVTLPNSVTFIGDYAFFGCTSLSSITIPSSVKIIGTYAFKDCSNLTSVTIPNSVTSIDSAFYGCTSLTSVTIPDSVTSIGASAFAYCTSLSSITIPGSVTSIAGHTFRNCTSLTSITIPDSVTSIGTSAFEDCTSLSSITIPDSVTSLSDNAFDGCNNLVIYGKANTSGYYYAKNRNIEFCCLSHQNINVLPLQEPTCTKEGLSEGKKCLDCEKIIVEQKVLPKSAHPFERGQCRQCFCYAIEKGFTRTFKIPTTYNWEYLYGKTTATNIVVSDAYCSGYEFNGVGWSFIYTVSINANDLGDAVIDFYYRTGENTGFVSSIKVCVIEHVHKLETVDGVSPTCTEAGLTEGTYCLECGVVVLEQHVLPAIGHTYGLDNTCSACGAVKSGAGESTTPTPGAGDSEGTTPAPCVHSWKAATCTKAKTCMLCGVTEGVAKGHEAGTAKVTKKATTTKSGTKVQKCTRCNTTVKTIKIKPAKLSLSKSSFTYTGKYISSKKLPKIIVKDGNGKTISSKYYTVKKPTNVKKMKNIGRYAYKITFKKSCKDYTGSKTVYLQITPKKTSVSSVRGTKKAVTVKWKKGKKAQVTGYQVMLATNSKFTKNKKTTTVKGYSKISLKVTKLKAKTKYFVKVRTYKTVKGVKIYSDWSKVKTVRTK